MILRFFLKMKPDSSRERMGLKWNLQIVFLRFQTGIQKPNHLSLVWEVEQRGELRMANNYSFNNFLYSMSFLLHRGKVSNKSEAGICPFGLENTLTL